MYVRSLLTLVNISDTIATPSMKVDGEAIHLYADNNKLYTSHPYATTLTEQIVGVRPSYIEDRGIVYYNSRGLRPEFNILSPNSTVDKLVLSTYRNDNGDVVFDWVDINDWIPIISETYWALTGDNIYHTNVGGVKISTNKKIYWSAEESIYIKGYFDSEMSYDLDIYSSGITKLEGNASVHIKSTNSLIWGGLYLTTDLINGNLELRGNGTGAINISGAYTLPTTSGTNKYVLTTNGSHASDWVDVNTLFNTLWTRDNGLLYPTTITDNVTTHGNISSESGHIAIPTGFLMQGQSQSNLLSAGLDSLLTLSIATSAWNSTAMYRFGSRSLENVMNDTGYGFRRIKPSTVIFDNWVVDCSEHEIQYATLDIDLEDEVTIEFTNPIVNKIITLVIIGNPRLPKIIISNVKILSGILGVDLLTYYIQVMCVNDDPVEYIGTINTPNITGRYSGMLYSELSDGGGDYSLYPNKYLRVASDGSEIEYRGLTGTFGDVTANNIPIWSDVSGCNLSDGYMVSLDLDADNSYSYLARADAIKAAIDTKKVQSVSADATIAEDTKVILVNKSSGNIILTFPSIADDGKARTWLVKDITGSDNSNTVTIATEGTETVEGATTFTIEGSGFARDVIFLTNYYIA